MLDYILSKMVLMIFLLLLVGAFVIVRDTVDSYFLHRAAINVVREIGERLLTISTAKYVKSEETVYVLPPFLEGGSRKMPYEINIACVNHGGVKYVVFAVVDSRGNVWAYDGFALPKGTEFRYRGFPAQSTATTDARRYIIMKKSIEQGKLKVDVCASASRISCTAGRWQGC